MTTSEIIAQLPYFPPFLFVDELIRIDEDGVAGTFLFDENLDFYQGHFKDYPVTPGVILTECMAQIGVVCLGIFLMKDHVENASIALSTTAIDFLKPVFPNEKVTVVSEKIYFRFNKLKCRVKMLNQQQEIVCEGMISGLIKKN